VTNLKKPGYSSRSPEAKKSLEETDELHDDKFELEEALMMKTKRAWILKPKPPSWPSTDEYKDRPKKMRKMLFLWFFFHLNNEYLTLTHTNSHDLSLSFYVGVFMVLTKKLIKFLNPLKKLDAFAEIISRFPSLLQSLADLTTSPQITFPNRQTKLAWHLCAAGTTCLRSRSKNYTGSLFSAGRGRHALVKTCMLLTLVGQQGEATSRQ
jgi:hypothetical protein